MNWFEVILIVAGISLDIFAAMEIEGAMLAKIRPRTLATVTGLVVLLQQVFFFLGFGISYYLANNRMLFKSPQLMGRVIAVVIFALLGLRLLVKAIRREMIQERCREITVRQYVHIIAVASFYTIFAGFACGLMELSIWRMFFTIIISSFLVTIGGIYTGYHYGFELKTKLYAAGTVFLWCAGAEILLRHVFHVIGA